MASACLSTGASLRLREEEEEVSRKAALARLYSSDFPGDEQEVAQRGHKPMSVSEEIQNLPGIKEHR